MTHHETGRLMARVAVTGALACGVTVAAVAGPAYAAGTTRYVGAAAGSDTSCASPGYTTVQAAVNAASPGDTVFLCGTAPYKEQVIITRRPPGGFTSPGPPSCMSTARNKQRYPASG